jgi:5-methylcytosine-specific restriction endonuclease McrA
MKFKGSLVQCGECGKEFKVSPSRQKTAKYCSKECADVHRHDTTRVEKIEKHCLCCGKVFYVHPCHSERRKFCSYECANQSYVKVENKICAYCGKTFESNPSSGNVCCSWECRVARSKTEVWPTRKKLLIQCAECGKEFWIKLSARTAGKGKFCSRECKINSQKIDNLSSPSFYGSSVWYQTRKRILERDNSTCQHCGVQEDSVHVHHKEYKRNGGDESDENLITLCARCHRIEHSNDKKSSDRVGLKS